MKGPKHSLRYAHDLIADATGNAAIIEWGNKKLNFIRKGDKNYLIATNFNISESNNIQHECKRYNIVESILSAEEPSIASFEKALSLSHQEGNFGTMYSQIGDLKNKKLYLYNFHDFSTRYEIDLTKDLAAGEANYTIRDLFPENFSESDFLMRVDCLARLDDVPAQKVTFQIHSDVEIPGSNISIRGSAAEPGRWSQEGQTFAHEGMYILSKTIDMKNGTLFDYTIHADNRKYRAVDKDWDRPTPRVAEINSDTTIIVNIADWSLKK